MADPRGALSKYFEVFKFKTKNFELEKIRSVTFEFTVAGLYWQEIGSSLENFWKKNTRRNCRKQKRSKKSTWTSSKNMKYVFKVKNYFLKIYFCR